MKVCGVGTWYRGFYGSWRDINGVQYLDGTYDKKEAIRNAQEVANKKNVIVTIHCSRGSNKGILSDYIEIVPN